MNAQIHMKVLYIQGYYLQICIKNNKKIYSYNPEYISKAFKNTLGHFFLNKIGSTVFNVK